MRVCRELKTGGSKGGGEEGKRVREGTGHDGKEGGRMREKGWEESDPNARSKNSDLGTL